MPRTRVKVRSLRSRWNRAFAGLFVVVVLGGVANFAGTRALVGTFRNTAERVEQAASLLAQLRTDIVPHALLQVSTADSDGSQRRALEASIEADFARGTAGWDGAERQLLQAAFGRWQQMGTAMGTPDRPSPVEQRGAAVAEGVPEVLELLEQAGGAVRARARDDLAEARRMEQATMVALATIVILVTGLMVRFARRLTVEVLRPVGMLRDSANELAAGDLDHRVELDRTDEFGDLAASFNAMADAISGSQRTLTRQANHDSLTGLANRGAFRARLDAALDRPNRRAGTQAVLFVDLDDFKDVNDTLGHGPGDELLCVAADRLLDAVRPGDLVARLGGDEFALLLDGVPDRDVAFALAERVVAALAAPVEISGSRIHVGASVGLAMRHDDSDADGLMREADVAMYTAKGRGKNRVERYDAALNDAAAERQALKGEVAEAVGRGELVLDYQPIVDLTTGGFAGVEALVRWQHPTRGLLPPSAFIAIAEETGAIAGIGSWVLETAAGQVQTWQRRYSLPEFKLAANVSVRQLDDPGFAAHVGDVLARTGLKPSSLVVEVTESMLADGTGGAAETLEALRGLGVQVALDDFGTAYSSIGYLRRLPIDILKIDRSFISGERADKPGDVLLEALIGLGQRLGLDVIPEGIEQLGQLAQVQVLGCRTGQGFLLARPQSAAAIDELLAAPLPLLPFVAADTDRTATLP